MGNGPASATNPGRATASGQQQQQRHSVQANGRMTHEIGCKVNIAPRLPWHRQSSVACWLQACARGQTNARCAAAHAKFRALAAFLHAPDAACHAVDGVCMSHLQDVAPTTRLADTALRSGASFAQSHLTSLNCCSAAQIAPQVPEGDCEAVDAQYKSSGAAQAHVSTASNPYAHCLDAAVKVSAAQGEELCTCRDHTFQIRVVYVLHSQRSNRIS